MTTPKHETHDQHAKPAAKDKPDGGEKVIDSLGQENPAQELEKKNLKDAQEKAAKEAKEAEKEAK